MEHLLHCNVKNKAVTHELSGDNWFSERLIDYAVCKKCKKKLLRKRFIDNKGNFVSGTITGLDKVQRKYDKYLADKIQTFDNDFNPTEKPDAKNIHYADFNGYETKFNGLRAGFRYNGEKWLKKSNGGRYI